MAIDGTVIFIMLGSAVCLLLSVIVGLRAANSVHHIDHDDDLADEDRN